MPQCYLPKPSLQHPSHPRTWVLYPSVHPSCVFLDHPSPALVQSGWGSSLGVFLLLDIVDRCMGSTSCIVSLLHCLVIRRGGDTIRSRVWEWMIGMEREIERHTLLDRYSSYQSLRLYVCDLLVLSLQPAVMPDHQFITSIDKS